MALNQGILEPSIGLRKRDPITGGWIDNPAKLGTKFRLVDAIQYRDGLMIALTAFVPLRRKNLVALDVIQHLQLDAAYRTVVISSIETKTGTPMEFEIPPFAAILV
jgi:hypothetical protein